MTKRELVLVSAAKAIGREIHHWSTILPGPMLADEVSGECSHYWNPLTEDGDALRLAVKLRLVIQHAPKYVVVMDGDRNVAEHQDTREHDGDECAATRRAIVRAAAEIGRSM